MIIRQGDRAERGRGRPAEGNKRQQILDAALSLFAERGFHGTAVPLVARAANVATGTIYHYFASKEELVNAVFRDAKSRLRDALLEGGEPARGTREDFLAVWNRLAGFARREPLAFRFLEMQDHVPYLDEESKKLEIEVLMPLWTAGHAIRQGSDQPELPVDVMMALVWGALVGVIKAERLGYLTLSDRALELAGETCWAAVSGTARNRSGGARSRSSSEGE
jgi:TetR/AcrR family transcriptional regulator, repressor of fatR-cypB operon